MKGIYDIHCHIVPGVDDGAKDLKTSVRMLQKEYDDGVRNIIATPHFRYDMFEPSLEQVKKQFLRVGRLPLRLEKTVFRCIWAASFIPAWI